MRRVPEVTSRAVWPAVLATAVLCAGLLTACGGDDKTDALTPNHEGPPSKCAGKNELSAEGSSGQQNAFVLFNQVWGEMCPGKKVSYTATGSGAGREQFIAGSVDFAGSDSPLVAAQIGPAADRCHGNPAWDLPVVFGPIALPYNLAGVPNLVVDAAALASIFNGAIQVWDDPALAALNPGVALPKLKVTPIYRRDPSGTTDNFQKYLTVAAPLNWTSGVGTAFRGGTGESAERSTGVIQAVQSTPGAIGYVEKTFADGARLPLAQIDTGGGAVPLTTETARNAVNAVTFAASGNDLVLDFNSTYVIHGSTVYPIVLATYEIVCSKGYPPGTAAAVKAFLTAAVNNGQTGLSAAGYVPLPDKVKERLVAAINALE